MHISAQNQASTACETGFVRIVPKQTPSLHYTPSSSSSCPWSLLSPTVFEIFHFYHHRRHRYHRVRVPNHPIPTTTFPAQQQNRVRLHSAYPPFHQSISPSDPASRRSWRQFIVRHHHHQNCARCIPPIHPSISPSVRPSDPANKQERAGVSSLLTTTTTTTFLSVLFFFFSSSHSTFTHLISDDSGLGSVGWLVSHRDWAGVSTLHQLQ